MMFSTLFRGDRAKSVDERGIRSDSLGSTRGLPAHEVIGLDGVSKSFHAGAHVPVLHSIDLVVCAGELVAITGPSGSGKSTLMDIMGTLSRPTSGTVRVGGIPLNHLSARQVAALRSTRIGFVFQQFNLLPSISALANVELPLRYRRVGADERLERARVALERVELGHRLNHLPGELSGGERQRVAIARALVGDPQVILADEPTGSLDRRTGADIVALLREVNASGASIIVVTHDVELAASVPRRIHITDGRIIADDSDRPGIGDVGHGELEPATIGAAGLPELQVVQ